VTGRAGHFAFFAVMGVATVLTLFRSYGFALLMTPEDFGRYASVIAAGAFCGAMLSYGLVEKSLKSFPRLFIEGRISALIGLSIDIEKRLFIRAMALLPAAFLVWLSFPQISLVEYLAIPVVAGLVAACSAGASLLRSAQNPFPLAMASLIRALVALGIGAAGAAMFSIAGAIGGELLGAIAFLAIAGFRRQAMRGEDTTTSADQALTLQEIVLQDWEGRILYFAGLFSAAPIYLDRLVVRAVTDAEHLGTYSLLATLVMAASAFIGIVAQVIGPRLVHIGRDDPTGRHRKTYVLKAIALSVAIMLAGFAIAAWFVIAGPLVAVGTSYGLTWLPLVLAMFLACGQVTVLLDWLLISLNREKAILLSAGLFLTAAVAVFVVFAIIDATVGQLLLMLGLAKCVHVLAQLAAAWPCPDPTPGMK
jgi:O-antigen/teichoic acid export membrane protein